jgi:hypothetical protein
MSTNSSGRPKMKPINISRTTLDTAPKELDSRRSMTVGPRATPNTALIVSRPTTKARISSSVFMQGHPAG